MMERLPCVCLLLLGVLVAETAAQISGPTTHLYSTGVKGEKGGVGEPGIKGVRGPDGNKGMQGSAGAKGSQGSKGVQGDPGDNGVRITGATGAIGATGSTGETGLIGLQGVQGDTGDMGTTGDNGAQGNKGANGVKGPSGPQGPPGPAGGRGPKGNAGGVGPKGDMGSLGPQGETGPRGPRGSEGDSLATVLSGRASNCATLQCIGATCEEGLAGAICRCIAGYQFVPGDSTRCQDVDECKQGVCLDNCVNTDGGYTCTCPPGYAFTSDNITCEIVSGVCDCSETEQCVNLASGAECIPSLVSVSDGRDSAAVAAQARKQVDVIYESDGMMNESWVLAFIVWSAVLTVVIIILSIWLVIEYRISSDEVKQDDQFDSNDSVIVPHDAVLMPSVKSLPRETVLVPSMRSLPRALPAPVEYNMAYNSHSRGMGNGVIVYN